MLEISPEDALAAADAAAHGAAARERGGSAGAGDQQDLQAGWWAPAGNSRPAGGAAQHSGL